MPIFQIRWEKLGTGSRQRSWLWQLCKTAVRGALRRLLVQALALFLFVSTLRRQGGAAATNRSSTRTPGIGRDGRRSQTSPSAPGVPIKLQVGARWSRTL
eukprot:6693969-Prymnesium_polylepis.2